jgi:hypothetical protein
MQVEQSFLSNALRQYAVYLFLFVGLISLSWLVQYGTLPDTLHINVGTVSDSQLITDFWLPESNGDLSFRWTSGDSSIDLQNYTSARALIISLHQSGPQNSLVNDTLLTVISDQQEVGSFTVGPDWRIYHVLVRPSGLNWQYPEVRLQSSTIRAGTHDLRRLGVVVSDVKITPVDGRLAYPLVCRVIVVTGLTLVVWTALRWFSPSWVATLGALLIGATAVALYRLDPITTDFQLPSFWYLALIGAGGLVVALTLRLLVHSHRLAISLVRERIPVLASWIVLAPLLLFLVLIASFSLNWRISHDTPLLFYTAWIIDNFRLVPYRDFFEQNLPATYLIYLLVGRLTNYGDVALRVFDLSYLASVLVITWVWLRPFGQRTAWSAAIFFGLAYLGYGPNISMQREFLMLFPICLALLAVSKPIPKPVGASLVGLGIGLAMAIKPQASVALPLFLSFVWFNTPMGLHRYHLVMVMLFSSVLPLLLTLIYLWQHGALVDFIAMYRNYIPLFAALTGLHQPIAGWDRVHYLFVNYMNFGGHHLWFLPAMLGPWMTLRYGQLTIPQRRVVSLLIGLAFVFSVYTLFQGRFWDYHWLIFLYFLIILSAFGLADLPYAKPLFRLVPLLVLLPVIVFTLKPPVEFNIQISGHPLPPIKGERVDQIAEYLQNHLEPGDTVQPLDWTGGALHALLIARAVPATSFVYDIQFYHHTSSQYIQALRHKFIDELTTTRPRFVVEIDDETKPWPSGLNTTRSFPELRDFLARNYRIVLRGEGYTIYERVQFAP